MSTAKIIQNKISYLEKHLATAKKYSTYTDKEIKNNDFIRSAVERELYVIAQAAIDLAEAIVAYKNFRKPTTMREVFDILAEHKIISRKFLENFIGIVGFRNALAHDYEDIRIEVLGDVLRNKLKEVKQFIFLLRKKLRI